MFYLLALVIFVLIRFVLYPMLLKHWHRCNDHRRFANHLAMLNGDKNVHFSDIFERFNFDNICFGQNKTNAPLIVTNFFGNCVPPLLNFDAKFRVIFLC